MRIVLVMLLLLSVASNAQTLTLPALLDSIDTKHPMLKMYDLDIRAMNAAAESAKALEAPRIGAGLWETPYDVRLWKDSEMEPAQGMFMLSAEQMIMNPTKRKAEYNYMLGMANVETANRKAARSMLRSEARANYYKLLVLEKKATLVQQNKQLMEYMLDAMETRFSSGMDRVGSYYQAQARLHQTEAMVEMISSERRAAEKSINSLLFRDANTSFVVDTTLNIPDYSDYTVDTSQIVTFRSDVLAVQQRINLLQLQRELERTKALPDFGIRYDHMFAFGMMPNQFSLMAMVTVPIVPWSRRSYSATAKSLHLNIEAQRYQQQALVNETSGMLNNMREKIIGMQRQVNVYEKNVVPTLGKSLQTTLNAFANNSASVNDLLDAWEAYQMTGMEYLDKLDELLEMQAEFEKILEL
jgi:outer membrane protein TolC